MIFVLAGMTGAGKDEAQRVFERNGYTPIVSTTTRPMRPGEKNGVNYFYVSNEEFQNMISSDQLLEHRVYHTLVKGIPDDWYYGVERKNAEIADNMVVVLDSVGYNAFVNYFGKDNCKLIWVETDENIRKERIKRRGDFDETEFARRNIKDAEAFGNLKDIADYIILNNKGIHHLQCEVMNSIYKYQLVKA